MAGLCMASEKHHVLELPIGKVDVYVQGNLASRSVVLLTVHDLGCNHYQYEDFVGHPKMHPITERAVWISVDLPGQSDAKEDLPATYTFPTLWDTASNLKAVLDYFKQVKVSWRRVEHAVLFGEGAGANILARFAMLHDEMVLGAVLIHCTGQTASIADSLRDKISESGTELELKQAIAHFRENLQQSINPKNLNRYITAYMQRKPLIDRINDLTCSVLLITGALAPQRKGCEKLYEAIMKVHKVSSCATHDLVVVENVANVLAERPDKVAESMQYFLQGIGLLSHVKMQTTPLNLNRRMSMEDYDRPVGRVPLAGGFRTNLEAPHDLGEDPNTN